MFKNYESKYLTVSETHAHTEYSNASGGFRDSTNRVEELIEKACQMGLSGIAITDHEILGGHIRAIKKVNEMKKAAQERIDKTGGEMSDRRILNFKLMLGNEIYVSKDISPENPTATYGHQILIALDSKGHEQLRRISSQAWENGFYVKSAFRKPSLMSHIKEVVGEDPGHLVCTSACLGSVIGINFQKFRAGKITLPTYQKEIDEYLKWGKEVFGDNFYLEIQPALYPEQQDYNGLIEVLCNKYKIEPVCACDVHYLTEEHRDIHHYYLNSEEGKPRETDAFYRYTYLMNRSQRKENLSYLEEGFVERALDNTIEISNACTDDYELFHSSIIPEIDIDPQVLYYDFKLKSYWKEKSFDAIVDLIESKDLQNLLFVRDCEIGYFNIYGADFDRKDEVWERVNWECKTYIDVSEILKDNMVKYPNVVKFMIDMIWTEGDSLVGPGRGSAMCFESFYLLGVTNASPLFREVSVDAWRFLSKERAGLPKLLHWAV